MADIDLMIATQPRILYEQGGGFYRSCGEERIQWLTPQQALYMFTQDAAYSLFEEHEKGTLEEGKLADLLVLSGDPFTLPPEQWEAQLHVEMTVVDGEVVYQSG